LLHNSGTKVLPIYNNFREAVGYDKGRVIAQNATFHAKRLGVPKGTVLFANVERFFNVDDEWITGYVEGMFVSGYKAGIYHDLLKVVLRQPTAGPCRKTRKLPTKRFCGVQSLIQEYQRRATLQNINLKSRHVWPMCGAGNTVATLQLARLTRNYSTNVCLTSFGSCVLKRLISLESVSFLFLQTEALGHF
jgi:hypothetical protein